MRKHPISPLRDIPISVSLFTTAFGLPNTPHSWLSRHLWICDCHHGDFRLHRLFRPHCSISICRERSSPEAPILHRENPRCHSSSNKLTIGNLFPIRANGSNYERNELGLRFIIVLTSNWLIFFSCLGMVCKPSLECVPLMIRLIIFVPGVILIPIKTIIQFLRLWLPILTPTNPIAD